MKLKTALKLSLVVNAIFVLAVGYMLATEIKLETSPAFIYVTGTPAADVPADLSVAAH